MEKTEHTNITDPNVVPPSLENPVPRWLIATYIIMPIIGIIIFVLYWNGSSGWLDRGYWQQLQKAANTTFVWKTKD